MNLDLNTIITLASLVGASLFFVAGYFLAPRTIAQRAAPRIPTDARSEVGGRVIDINATPPGRGPAALHEMLIRIAESSGTHGAAIYDAQGRLVDAVGPAPDPRVAALAGLVGRLVTSGQAATVIGQPHCVQLEDQSNRIVRFRPVEHSGQPLLVTTVLCGRHEEFMSAESAVVKALPRLVSPAIA